MTIIKPSTAFKSGADWVSAEVRAYHADQTPIHVDAVADVRDNDFEKARWIYVRSKAADYRLDLSSGAADDGDTVLRDNMGRRYVKVPDAGSPGRWWDEEVDDLPGRDAYDDEPKGFGVAVADTGPGRAAVYFKASNASADWSDPFYLTPAPVGGDVVGPDSATDGHFALFDGDGQHLKDGGKPGALATKDAVTADEVDDSTSDHKFASADQLGKLDDLPTASQLADALGDKVDVVALAAHVTDDDNPHGVTADQVGLGNVDNTSDADKPMSTAQAAAMYKAATLAPVAERLVPAEPAAAAIDLIALAGLVRDDEDRAKSWAGDVNDKLQYQSPSIKYVRNRAGVLVPGTTMRCDHDPATGTGRGVPIEPQSTNRVLQSQNFASGSWTKFATVWSYSHNDTGIAAPDGTSTASRIERTASGNSIFLRSAQGPTSVAQGTVLTISFFIYYPSGPSFDIQVDDDQSGGQVTITAAARWQRISVRLTKGSGGQGYVDFQSTPAIGTVFWFWGAQVEQSPVVTSYVPTTTAQATRAADNISLPVSAMPWNNSAGAVVMDFMPAQPGYASGFNRGIFAIERTGSAPYSAIVTMRGSNQDFFVRVAGADGNGVATSAAVADLLRYKLALAWRVGRAVLAINGTLYTLSPVATSSDLPTDPVTFRIGASRGGSTPLGGSVRSAFYLPYDMSDGELQARTTL